MSKETILAADIGGTNTRFILFEIDTEDLSVKKGLIPGKQAPGKQLLSKKYMNQDFNSFLDVLNTFLREGNLKKPPLTACFAVAGPVTNNKVKFTNRDSWSIEGDIIQEKVGIRKVRLINDFLAVGYGLLTIDEETECKCLQRGIKDLSSPIACIGAGTGLGECFLTPNPYNGNYSCFPSEGGHAEFSPRNSLEIGLLEFLKEKFQQPNRVSVERVISGSGLANIYEYLAKINPKDIDAEIHSKIESAGDLKGAVIATNQKNKLCKQTMEIFVTAYGAEAGVACLKWLPYGGLYLTGGLTPKNIDLIADPKGPFLAALLDKGRVSHMLKNIPVYAVVVEDLGERGAHRTAFSDFESISSVKNDSQQQSSSKSSWVVNTALLLALGTSIAFFLAKK